MPGAVLPLLRARQAVRRVVEEDIRGAVLLVVEPLLRARDAVVGVVEVRRVDAAAVIVGRRPLLAPEAVVLVVEVLARDGGPVAARPLLLALRAVRRVVKVHRHQALALAVDPKRRGLDAVVHAVEEHLRDAVLTALSPVLLVPQAVVSVVEVDPQGAVALAVAPFVLEHDARAPGLVEALPEPRPRLAVAENALELLLALVRRALVPHAAAVRPVVGDDGARVVRRRHARAPDALVGPEPRGEAVEERERAVLLALGADAPLPHVHAPEPLFEVHANVGGAAEPYLAAAPHGRGAHGEAVAVQRRVRVPRAQRAPQRVRRHLEAVVREPQRQRLAPRRWVWERRPSSWSRARPLQCRLHSARVSGGRAFAPLRHPISRRGRDKGM
mmetsp:Transcript_10854/g.33008  ORF Transcript_10854/g.33008 Transcript_10854/m.33008 type:complete len:386 (+) Transcript_10854:675-1832(+)